MKTMIFIDFQNFNINMHEYYKSNPKLTEPRITYPKLANALFSHTKHRDSSTLVKTFLFAYKPCELLLKNKTYESYYNWLNGMKNKPYFEVIEGRQEIRPLRDDIKINVADHRTYTTEEKGTDINIAVSMLSKAYSNAYDVAILVSGDTDYLPVIEQLHNLGKIVILATLPQQNISKFKTFYDQHIKITDDILQLCKNTSES